VAVADKARSYNRFVQQSYRNSVNAVQTVHQSVAAMYVDMLQLGGLPEDLGDKMKDKHGQFIEIIYSSVAEAFGEVGELIVRQVENMGELADDFGLSDEDK
jgi:hypothetical protein